MKNISKCIFIICLMLMLVACENDSGLTFKGEGENWSGELITTYDFWGKEYQSVKITYKDENPEQLTALKISVESPDFLGWGLDERELDEKGIYYSGDVFKFDKKTPSSSEIILTIEGDESENITLSSSL